jgi:hypothetical protein
MSKCGASGGICGQFEIAYPSFERIFTGNILV